MLLIRGVNERVLGDPGLQMLWGER